MTTDTAPTQARKIAGAPISWGVCEVPGWGYQLGPERVLSEAREVGLVATELGPEGFLPSEPDATVEVLSQHHLQAVGGFTPLLLHVPGLDPVPEVERILERYAATGAGVLVLSADSGGQGYDTRPELDEQGWQTLLTNLDRVSTIAAQRRVQAVLHPHVGTMIETGEEVQQVLDGSWISLCLDTGHLLIGGTDPAELARQAPDRIAHLHLKDVNSRMAAKVRSGRLTYSEAVAQGMYRPLGSGDVDVPAIVGYLRARRYDGWYTLEQDTVLTEEPKDEGPARDVRASAEYLRTVLDRTD
jgi:inosose dehydratase